jgi:hypothetical protein
VGRTIAGEHFYGPKSPDAVDVPPRLGALCVVSCRRRDGREADLAVVDRAPAPGWRGIADAGQRRAWREACDGRAVVWLRLYGPELDAVAEHRALAAAIRSRLAEPGR